MEHEPARLLCNTDGAMDFVGRYAVLRGSDEPYARQPFIQSNWAVFEDRANFDAELSLAVKALPDSSG
jgi:hypothetical protein